jgi:hypothetical protein
MFEDLYDGISLLFSWRWPVLPGEVTAVNLERIKHYRGWDTLRLAVAYKFSIGAEGPYTGESFWTPSFFINKRVTAARHKIHNHQQVLVRYRPDDPSVNTLDRTTWRGL